MNAAENALVLIAEAAAHGVTVHYNDREIGLWTHKYGWEPQPGELTKELDAAANEIWAVLHHYRPRATQ
ncbi:hypothetical protein SAMN06295879_1018 [Agreia bicolorata]|uniref:Uncharacterized protein n=1 Tax=Agreia bicolorata TaxID=110935 RepID=A0A1T4XBE4_9MICO|nr:hypothetical protein SAMN06295879_1018 [Agreia bicolorata]